MIPFVETPSLPLGPLTLHVFGFAVAVAVLVGFAIARRRFMRFELTPEIGERMATWLLVGGFLGAHLFAVLFYFPGAVADDPWLLLRVWEPISSFGAMIGGLAGAGLYLRCRASHLDRHQRWAYLDVAAFVFPFSLALGRVGCALVHDHPGGTTGFPLAVSLRSEAARTFIMNVYVSAGQADLLPARSTWAALGFHDLGLYEMVYLAVVVLPVLVWIDRKRRASGFFLCAFIALYMPVRFGLDFLRLNDARYAGLTPAQWVALCALILLPFLWMRVSKRRPAAPGEAHTPTTAEAAA